MTRHFTQRYQLLYYLHVASSRSIIQPINKCFNFHIMFGAVDSAAESTNMSLSIGFSLKIAFFTSMALYFHFFQKNNIKACCTDSLLKAVGSVSCSSVFSQPLTTNFLPSTYISVNTHLTDIHVWLVHLVSSNTFFCNET